MQNNVRNAIGLPKEKMKMKIKDAIQSVKIYTMMTEEVYHLGAPCYSRSVDQDKRVEVFYTDQSKLPYMLGIDDDNQLEFVIDTISKLSHCEYEFETIDNVMNLIVDIDEHLWQDMYYTRQLVEDIVHSYTGLSLKAM